MGKSLKDIHVAVTGLLVMDNPYPGVGFARCLRHAPEFQGRITGLVFETLTNGIFFPDLFDRIYLVPFPSAGEEALLQRLEEIHRRDPIDVIVPSLDSEVLLYAKLYERLKALGIALLLPSLESVKSRGKNLLYEFGLQHQIRVPRTVALNNVEEVQGRVGEIGTPFLLKALLSDARICSSLEEGEIEYGRLFDIWGYPILMQEYIFGDEFDVIGLMDRGSRWAGGLAMKKLGLTDKGKASSGVSLENPELLALTRSILEKLNWVGPAECEFLKEHRGGAYYLMEINSRFPAWLFLTAGSGFNLPLMSIRLALDLPVKANGHYEVGRLFVRTVSESVIRNFALMEFSATGEIKP
ncbi:MAG: carbamoyl-phosphate-synthetase [Desulfobacteraceae bacterium]|nr:MAG: carbamoyl-phosphate-synthetase [Desulfobacteraceae bacterium]